eukprot:8560218-Pyramimonas_sp.AAC.1
MSGRTPEAVALSPSSARSRDPLLYFSPQPLVRRKIGTQDSHFPKGGIFQNLGPAQLASNPVASWTTQAHSAVGLVLIQPPTSTPDFGVQSPRGPVQLLRHMRRARALNNSMRERDVIHECVQCKAVLGTRYWIHRVVP